MKIPVKFFRHALAMLAILYSSCVYDKRELPEPIIPIDTTLVTCDSIQPVTYNNLVKSILETNCTSFSNCHGTDAPPGFDYTFYAGIKMKADSGKIQERVLNLKDMPPSNSPGPLPLDTCTLVQIQEWLNNGAPE